MDKQGVNKFMKRFPDKILSTKTLTSDFWMCSKCCNKVEGPYVPSEPCSCGSIFWEACTNNEEE